MLSRLRERPRTRRWSADFRRAPCGRRGCRGFSLAELLVTAVLMIILVTMLYGPNSRRVQRARMAACRRNLQFIYMTLQTYAAENRDQYPALKGAKTSEAPLALLVPRWTTATEHFICPASGHSKLPAARSFADRSISYAYVMGLRQPAPPDQWLLSDEQLDAYPKAKRQRVFSEDGKDPANNHRKIGGNILFGDGRTEECGVRALWPLFATNGAVILNPKP